MQSCATNKEPSRGLSRDARWRAIPAALALAGLLLAGSEVAASEDDGEEATANDRDLEARGEATLGANLYLIDDPYDDDDLGGFLDQYRYTRDKGDSPPYFVDLMHLDFGLVRDDETYLFRVERFSPNQLNDRGELEVDWKGLGFDLDYWRFRTEDLRFYPEGTYQDQNGAAFPAFGTQYNNEDRMDAGLDELRQSNQRLWVRRTGIDGELRFRPQAAGFTLPVLAEVSVASGYEERKGWRQDSFILDSSEFTPAQNARFRGRRRRIDQNVTKIGGGFVLSPATNFTADFDLGFESFREDANAVTSADIFATDPTPAMLTFNYVPDTNRITGSSRLAAQIGDLNLQGSGFVTHLEQSNRAPLRRRIDKHEVTTWSLHGGFDLPFAERYGASGFVKVAQRRNRMNRHDVAPQLPGDPLLTQVDPILRRRTEVNGEFELSARPQAGALVATGYRFDWIKRNLRYGRNAGAIDPSVSLVEEDSNKHTLFLRGRARLLRSIQVSGELGWEYQPEVSFPRDPRSTLYFDGRGSYSLPKPVPMTFAVFGGVKDAHGTGMAIDGVAANGTRTSVRKDLDRLGWNYGATVTVLPTPKTTIATTFTQSRDEQDMPYARTAFPRYFGNVTVFEEPRRLHWESDVKSLTISATQQVTETVALSPFTNVSWVKADFPNSGNLSRKLEGVNEIRSQLLGVGANIDWTAIEGLALGLGYRFDEYIDREDKDPISRDDERHTFTLTATVDLDLLNHLQP
jgi:hypothetical protein